MMATVDSLPRDIGNGTLAVSLLNAVEKRKRTVDLMGQKEKTGCLFFEKIPNILSTKLHMGNMEFSLLPSAQKRWDVDVANLFSTIENQLDNDMYERCGHTLPPQQSPFCTRDINANEVVFTQRGQYVGPLFRPEKPGPKIGWGTEKVKRKSSSCCLFQRILSLACSPPSSITVKKISEEEVYTLLIA